MAAKSPTTMRCCLRKAWQTQILPPSAGERNVLRLIAARLLCAVGEPHCYAETTLTTICAGEEFSAKGKLVLSDGWRAMERKMLGELLGKQKEPAVLRCAGAEPVQRCRCRTERGSNVSAKAFHRGPSTSCDGNRQCRQYAGGRRTSGHRYPGNESRHHRKAGAEGLSGTQGHQENQGAAAHG